MALSHIFRSAVLADTQGSSQKNGVRYATAAVLAAYFSYYNTG